MDKATVTFEPSRLVLARRRKGWKRAELGRRSGLKVRTITAYELGERGPQEDSLQALAKALEYPVEFFYRAPVETLQDDGVSFRALTKMTAPQRDRALAAGEMALELAEWTSRRFELPEPDVPDLRLENNPESAAMALRAAWGLSDRPISSLIRLLEAKGVRVFSLAEDDRALDGFSFWRGSEPYIFLNTQKSAERSRFDAAHELGHLVLHRHGGVIGIDVEREAMAFASAFLMPKSSIDLHAPRPPSIPSLIVAKKVWGVSLTALIRRLYDLQMFSRWYYRALCIQVQKLGFRDREPDPMPREMSHVWPLVFQGMRLEGLRRTDIAKLLNWPLDELKGLVFQLVLSAEPSALGGAEVPIQTTPVVRGSFRIIRSYPQQGITPHSEAIMSKRKHDVHVVKNTEGKGWVAKQDGEVVSRHRTQGAAHDSGRREAKKDGVDLVIHGTDGKIRQKDSFGNDPNPPKG